MTRDATRHRPGLPLKRVSCVTEPTRGERSPAILPRPNPIKRATLETLERDGKARSKRRWCVDTTEKTGAATPPWRYTSHTRPDSPTHFSCVRGHSTMRNLPSLALGALRPAHEAESMMRAVAPQKRVARLVEPLSARAMVDKHIRCERAPVQCTSQPQPQQQLLLSRHLCVRVAAPRGRCRPIVHGMGVAPSCGPPPQPQPQPQHPSRPSHCRARAERRRRRRCLGTRCR